MQQSTRINSIEFSRLCLNRDKYEPVTIGLWYKSGMFSNFTKLVSKSKKKGSSKFEFYRLKKGKWPRQMEINWRDNHFGDVRTLNVTHTPAGRGVKCEHPPGRRAQEVPMNLQSAQSAGSPQQLV